MNDSGYYKEHGGIIALMGSKPAEPGDTPAELVNRTAWSLGTNVDDLIKAYRDTPDLLDANRLEIARAYGRLCWLVSALQATERVKLESSKFNLATTNGEQTAPAISTPTPEQGAMEAAE